MNDLMAVSESATEPLYIVIGTSCNKIPPCVIDIATRENLLRFTFPSLGLTGVGLADEHTTEKLDEIDLETDVAIDAYVKVTDPENYWNTAAYACHCHPRIHIFWKDPKKPVTSYMRLVGDRVC